MIKLLWYTYFAGYMLFLSMSKIKIKYLKSKDIKKADIYIFQKLQQLSKHILKRSKTQTQVSGLENIPTETCVFIANHQAIFDGFMLSGFINKPIGFIAKKETKKIPLVGSWLRDTHSVFIDREDPRESIKAIYEGVENLKKGYSMVIFPEGTRSLGGPMKPFKKGSMKLALKAGVPIVPITIDGTYKVLETGNQVTGNLIKMLVHKPIYVDSLSKEEQNNLVITVQEIIAKGLEELRRK